MEETEPIAAARVLRELRIQSRLSMRKAGVVIGYTDSYISHIENGRTDVPRGDCFQH